MENFYEEKLVAHPKYGVFTLWIPFDTGSTPRVDVLTAAGKFALAHPGKVLEAVPTGNGFDIRVRENN